MLCLVFVELRVTDFFELPFFVAEMTFECLKKFFELFPFSCRKAQGGTPNPLLRELIVPFGNAGYVALFEIEDSKTVTILAVRHQREDDYH